MESLRINICERYVIMATKHTKHTKQERPFTAQLSMAGSEAVIDVTGVIGWDTEPMAFTQLVDQAREAGCELLTVRINSMGGFCYDGLAMGDCLRGCGMRTVGVVLGTAQSMAAYLLQCCDERVAFRNATIMIHQPSAGVCGTVDEILEEANYLVRLRDQMFADMAARCGKTGAELDAEHKVARMYTAADALEKGLIDRIEQVGAPASREVLTEQDEAGGGHVYSYNRVRDALAMLADEPEEDAAAPVHDPKPGEDPEKQDAEEAQTDVRPDRSERGEVPDPDQIEPRRGDGDAAAAAAAAADDDDDDDDDDAQLGVEERDGVAAQGEVVMTRAQVEELLARREAQLLADLGVEMEALPRSVGGNARAATYSIEELDRMPAAQRLEILEGDPDLMRRYAASM